VEQADLPIPENLLVQKCFSIPPVLEKILAIYIVQLDDDGKFSLYDRDNFKK
jgi:hypothetical protein